MVITTIKQCNRFVFHKINKNVQRNPVINCLVHSWYDVTQVRFKTL